MEAKLEHRLVLGIITFGLIAGRVLGRVICRACPVWLRTAIAKGNLRAPGLQRSGQSWSICRSLNRLTPGVRPWCGGRLCQARVSLLWRRGKMMRVAALPCFRTGCVLRLFGVHTSHDMHRAAVGWKCKGCGGSLKLHKCINGLPRHWQLLTGKKRIDWEKARSTCRTVVAKEAFE